MAGPTFRTRPFILLSILAIATSTLAHGGHEKIPEGEVISPDPIGSTRWTHILIQALAWGVIFPIGMVLGLVKSRLHVPVQVLGTALAIVGQVLGHIKGGRQYAKNAHAGFASWLFFMLVAQVALGVVLRLHFAKGILGKIRPIQVWIHLILGAIIPVAAWVQMLLGGIASQGFCQGDHTGQCLAHFIMGSAFIAYGIVLTILLLLGQQWLKRSGRSQEFYDSVLISVWGCVNTFTEHRWGGPWVKNDLQHTSMGIIWWAAGLVGIWLSKDRQGRPKRNLIPGLVIILTGWAFGGHPQELEISSHVHKVFGYSLMLAGITRIIEISFIMKDRNTLDVHPDGRGDDEINSFQYLPPFLLYASGFLFMGATEEQLQLLAHNHVTHVSYILILYSISFLLFLFVLLLIHLYSTNIKVPGKPVLHSDNDATPSEAGGNRLITAADRQAHDAQEFELEGLMSDDDGDAESKAKPNGNVRAG